MDDPRREEEAVGAARGRDGHEAMRPNGILFAFS